MPVKVFFLTTRGLEDVSANEIAALPGLTIGRIGYRRITASCAKSLVPLCDLQTVDDAFLDLDTWQGVGSHRRTLELLRGLSSRLDLRAAAANCARLRPIPPAPAFSVTASFVGKRNYSAEEIKSVLSDGVMANHDWRYTDDDAAADLNVRVFIEREIAFVGLRLGRKPLHERQYKKAHIPGSLKPPIAAAMLRLAGLAPGQLLLDPCCGAGTILAEAGKCGAAVLGGDIDLTAISAARLNTRAAGIVANINAWDVRALPIPDGSIDRIASNLPWGRQIIINSSLALFYRKVCAEMRRILAPGGRIALLTNAPQLVGFRDLRRDDQLEISLYGQRPTILTFSS
jgi:tRNA (guanine6-N2)-methyltransferase